MLPSLIEFRKPTWVTLIDTAAPWQQGPVLTYAQYCCVLPVEPPTAHAQARQQQHQQEAVHMPGTR
jgi:hypothetical protein